MGKLWKIALGLILAFSLTGCGGTAPAPDAKPTKEYASTEQVVKDLVIVKVPNELKSEESANWGGTALTQEGQTWELIVTTGSNENMTQEKTWDATVKLWKSLYSDIKEVKVAGKDGYMYDAGSALMLHAPINDAKFLHIRIVDTASDTPEARAKVLDLDIVKYVLSNISFK